MSGYPQMTQMGDGRWQISRRHGAGTLPIAPTAHDELAQATGLGMTKNGTGGLQARHIRRIPDQRYGAGPSALKMFHSPIS